MKNSKIFRSVMAVAVAMSLMGGCFLMTGCDNDSKSQKKTKKVKTTSVEDDDKESKDEKDSDDEKNEESEKESDDSDGSDLDDVADAELAEAIDEDSDEVLVDEFESEDDLEVEDEDDSNAEKTELYLEDFLTKPEDFDNPVLKEYAQQFVDLGLKLDKVDVSSFSNVEGEEGEGALEMFMATNMQDLMANGFDSETGMFTGISYSANGLSFDTEEHALDAYKVLEDQFVQGYPDGVSEATAEGKAFRYDAEGMVIWMEYFESDLAIIVYHELDFDVLYAGMYE